MKINVINRRLTQGGIYVGRPSTLGNPFVIGRDGSRGQVIQKYRRWLWQKIQQNDPDVMLALDEIIQELNQEKDVFLSCHCAPKPCHTDVIKSCVEWLMS